MIGTLLALGVSAVAVAAQAPTVSIGQTTVTGVSLVGVDFFGGLPFAKPPVGDLRFAPPQLVTTLDGPTFDATQVSTACSQNALTTPIVNMAEDCLQLDIYRPAGISTDANLPVMTWIYGGGFTEGTSGIYNGSAIVAHSVARGTPVVFAALNYRLGALGWPAGSEAASQGALNLGLKDQLAGLEWVQANIGQFGGDKTKVTVFGESAGAISIANLFFNSKLETLVRGVILESGSASTTAFFNAQEENDLWSAFSAAVPACSGASQGNTFSCLRSAPVEDILNAALFANSESPLGFAFRPVIDGPSGVIPDLPSKLIEKGDYAKIPFISGTNLDEGTLFSPTTISSKQDIINFLANGTNSIANSQTAIPQDILDFTTQLVDQYSPDPADGSPFGTGSQTFGLSPFFKLGAAVGGDSSFQALRRAWLTAAAGAGVKNFGYLFTDSQPNSGALGVFHSSEIKYVYGTIADTPAPASSKALSGQMMDYWISFATSLDPNDGLGNARVAWPQYTAQNAQIIQLNSQNLTAIPDDYRSTQIDFINAHPIILMH